jgi:pimeloyl-ACP methyl ester carboxylesterase
MPEIAFRGIRAFYDSWGEGPSLLLLHAGGSSSSQWKKVGEYLSKDRRLIAPDCIGFGGTESWPEPGALTHDLQAELVAQVLKSEAVEQIDIVGHSYGGASAVRLFLRCPQKVRSLVLIEPIMSWLLNDAGDPLYEDSVRVAKFFIGCVDSGRNEEGWEAFLDSRNGAGTWSRLSDKARDRFLSSTRNTKEGFISNLNNHTSLRDCHSINVQTTIVCGAETTAPDRRTTELLKDVISDAAYHVIPGAAHMSPFTHPAEVAHIIATHLQQRKRGN